MNHLEHCEHLANALNIVNWTYSNPKQRHTPMETIEACIERLQGFTWDFRHVQRVVKQGDLVGFENDAEILDNFSDAFAEYVLGMRKPLDCWFEID
jgi:hypothetical protein